MGRRLVPVTLGIAVLGWLLSGLKEVGLHQRGIYERFGRPIAVLAPGLHAGLPWPFGRVVAVENGAVHELQLSDLTEAAQPDRQPDDVAEGRRRRAAGGCGIVATLRTSPRSSPAPPWTSRTSRS
ncbi:Uncharacterised protein [Raoultella terrigena]|uniref:Uncharacterized protein n=1 Tax=Raoultella terrigena TaxID=577 RepID=A0A4U9CZ97_RAOTE|nr:Uncharacterised protein [Raoultella terrigena]